MIFFCLFNGKPVIAFPYLICFLNQFSTQPTRRALNRANVRVITLDGVSRKITASLKIVTLGKLRLYI